LNERGIGRDDLGESSMFRTALLPLALLVCVAVGCENANEAPGRMEIDADSGTNPPHYDRDIPSSAVHSDQGTQNTSEQTANTENDSEGPSQEDSLAGAYNLQDQRGHPVLLVFAGDPDAPPYARLKAAWRDHADAMKQNNVALVESLLKGQSAEASKTLPGGESQVLRSRYGIQPSQFKVILLDGQGKSLGEWEGDDVKFDEMLKSLPAG
jgi:hypothetical protein